MKRIQCCKYRTCFYSFSVMTLQRTVPSDVMKLQIKQIKCLSFCPDLYGYQKCYESTVCTSQSTLNSFFLFPRLLLQRLTFSKYPHPQVLHFKPISIVLILIHFYVPNSTEGEEMFMTFYFIALYQLRQRSHKVRNTPFLRDVKGKGPVCMPFLSSVQIVQYKNRFKREEDGKFWFLCCSCCCCCCCSCIGMPAYTQAIVISDFMKTLSLVSRWQYFTLEIEVFSCLPIAKGSYVGNFVIICALALYSSLVTTNRTVLCIFGPQ